MDQFVVDTEKGTYSCRKWELCGIPCAYFAANMAMDGKDLENYVHFCYPREAFLKAYEQVICPINSLNNWPKIGKNTLLPPEKLKMPGRPKRKSKIEPNEGQKTHIRSRYCQKKGNMKMTCNLCKQKHHNSRILFQANPFQKQ